MLESLIRRSSAVSDPQKLLKKDVKRSGAPRASPHVPLSSREHSYESNSR